MNPTVWTKLSPRSGCRKMTRQQAQRAKSLKLRPTTSAHTSNKTAHNMKLNRTQKNGFTLVEIMIVVGIIGMLAAIAIPNFIRYREASRRSVCIANLKQLSDAKTQWGMEKGKKSTAIPVEADLIGSDGYIRIKPSCPSEGDDYFTTIGDLKARVACSLGSVEGHSL